MNTITKPFPSLDEINKIGDLFEAITVAEDNNVDIENLVDTEEIKERLVLEFQRRNGVQVKKEVANAMIETSEENRKKRLRLIHIFRELGDILGADHGLNQLDIVEEFLQQDGTTNNFHKDCQRLVKDLDHGECVILVAGESSAGKSSFLNLLLESPGLLPVHTNSCTSTITTIRYGKRKKAQIIYNDPGVPHEVIDLESEGGLSRMHDIAFMKGNERENGHRIKELQIFVPVGFLKTGLVLADTPGIGENEFLESYLHQYIANNQILGFIYVIMSDAAGGVKEDRLLLLLKLILEEQKKDIKALTFDPKASLFVCNRFDAIPEEERLKVKEHILNQLDKHWPDFEPEMAVFFSTKKALRDVMAHEDYISQDYRILLDGINKLYSVSLDRRIRASYKWIENVWLRVTFILKTAVKRIDSSERGRLDQTNKINARLEKMKENTNKVIKELRVEINESIRKICEELRDYLSTEQAKSRLCSEWKDEEIPTLTEKVKSPEHWLWIKERVDKAFYSRVCTFLDEWEMDDGKICTIEDRLISDAKLKLGFLEDDISDIESVMILKPGIKRGDRGLRKSSGRFPFYFDDISLKLSLTAKAQTSNPLFAFTRSGKPFSKNPKKWAQKRAEKLLQQLIGKTRKKNEADKLKMFITHLMQSPQRIVERIEQKIPCVVEADMKLLSRIKEDGVKGKGILFKYKKSMVAIENLRKNLMEYGEGYIFVNDFKSNEVKIFQEMRLEECLSGTFTPNLRQFLEDYSKLNHRVSSDTIGGLWYVVLMGKLTGNQNENEIAIKMYLPSSGVEHTFQEVAKLRCMTHLDMPLAEFLGIHHASAQIPAFIYDGSLVSLKHFMRRSASGIKALRILKEVALGLKYIHSKGLVHMELTKSTITINRDGCIRLTGACMPRRAFMPTDYEIPFALLIYLSPEVLREEVYIEPADVYGFGILCYELVSDRDPFEDERKMSVRDFLAAVNPVEMLRLNEANDGLSQYLVSMISSCIDVDSNQRPNVATIIDELNKMNDDFQRDAPHGRIPPPHEVFRMSINMPVQG